MTIIVVEALLFSSFFILLDIDVLSWENIVQTQNSLLSTFLAFPNKDICPWRLHIAVRGIFAEV